MFNWLFVFGNNQKIEFRNFFNQISDKTTVLSEGRDFYGGSYKIGSELGFQSRSIYSGQINGDLNFNQCTDQPELDPWLWLYQQLQPDTRRIEKSSNEDAGPDAPYTTSLNFNADPKLLGRLTLDNYEHLWVGGLNYSQKFPLRNFDPEIQIWRFSGI